MAILTVLVLVVLLLFWRDALLVFAVHHRCRVLAQVLLRGGANPNSATPARRLGFLRLGHFEAPQPMLVLALRHGDVRLARALLNAGADPNLGSEFGTPLLVACHLGDVDLVDGLLKAGADLHVHSDTGWRPSELERRPGHVGHQVSTPSGPAWVSGGLLHAAAYFPGHVDLVRFLLQKGLDVNGRAREGNPGRYTPLEVAARAGDVDVMTVLLESGARMEADALLRHACFSNNPRALQFCLERGADCSAVCEDKTPLLLLVGLHSYQRGEPTAACVQALCEAGADVDARYHTGGTALMSVAQSGYVHAVQVLLQWRADVRLRDGKGRTALDHARDAQKNHSWIDPSVWNRIVELLEGAEVSQSSSGPAGPPG